MKKRIIVVVSAGILTIGLISGFAYAKGISPGVSGNDGSSLITDNNSSQKSSNYNSMIKIMQDNGFTQQAQYLEEGNFKAMDSYMNNISDDDYDKMINIMKQNGYGDMANVMQSIGKDNMIKMHNSMGGVAGMMRW